MFKAVKKSVLAVNTGLLLTVTGCMSTAEKNQLMLDERAQNAITDMDFYNSHAPAFDGVLTEEMAIKFAQQYNIDLWVAQQQVKIQNEIKQSTYLNMLPSLMLSTEQSRRDRFHVSDSVNIETGETTLSNTYSSEKEKSSFRVSATWNMLDFGLTYLTARQQENKEEIARLIRKRTRQKLILDVKAAYWRSVTALEAAKVANSIGAIIDKQRDVIRNQTNSGNIAKEDSLKRELPLLGRQKTLKRYEREAKISKAELGRLIGLPVGSDFKLETIDFNKISQHSFDLPKTDILEQYALMNRTELYSKDLKEKIMLDDAKSALLKMLPSPSLFYRYDNDQDDLLRHHDWNTVGLTASWNLFSIPSRYMEHKVGLKKAELENKERMAMAVAILTQLNIAVLQYEESLKRLEFSYEISTKRADLLDSIISKKKSGTSHSGQILEQKIKFLQDRTEFLMAFAEAATAKARIYSTMGIDPTDNGKYILDDLKTPKQIINEKALQETPELSQIENTDVLTDSHVIRASLDQL